jgi:DNA-binding NarL/FixJ family response regulator
MPGLRGTDVVEAVLERDPHARVVMLTASTTDPDVDRLHTRGIVVLERPVTIEAFKAAMEVAGLSAAHRIPEPGDAHRPGHQV